MAWEQRLSSTDTEATFDLDDGEYLMLLFHNGGTWQLSILTPDDEEISVTSFSGSAQERVEVPEKTRLKVSGGTLGAKLWTNKIRRHVGDFL